MMRKFVLAQQGAEEIRRGNDVSQQDGTPPSVSNFVRNALIEKFQGCFVDSDSPI
jgi:hypothetical protein